MSESQEQAQATPEVEVSVEANEATPTETSVEKTVETKGDTFTRDEVNRVNKRTRLETEAKTREATERAISEQLGVPIEEAKQFIAERKEAEEARKSELEKAQGKLTKAEAKAQQSDARADGYQSQLASVRKEYALRDALRDAGINSERIALALRVADRDSLEVGDDGTVTGLEDAVTALNDASPEWFTKQPLRPRTSPDAALTERPVLGVWDMPDDQFKELQDRASRGERVTLPPMR